MGKKIFFTLSVFLTIVNLLFSQQDHKMDTGSNGSGDAVLIPGLGNYHHKVSTNNKTAQKFFDQGLVLMYAFNHNEAIRSFQKAAELDPMLAMAYWGIAFALGPNYNLPADNEQRKLAYKSINKAIKHSENSTQKEKDYINALSKRYTKNVEGVSQQTLDLEFKNAMKELYDKYPDDPDAATLYAESMMDLKPWQLWNKDGTPAEGTLEIVSVLESVIKKYPMHPGANHLYIHAVEASNDPGRALASANILKTLVPAAGHLVHMPAHILFRIGDYEGTSIANIKAIESDEAYIKKYKPEGIYPVMYYNHNLNFLSVSAMMEGKYDEALKNANQVRENVLPALSEMQMLEGYAANPVMIMICFNKWNDIISLPDADSNLIVYSGLLNYGKALAYSKLGNIEKAIRRKDMFLESKNKLTDEMVIGLNPASLIFSVALGNLEAFLSAASGDSVKAIDLLMDAASKELGINYDEPPDWYPTVTLSLGAYLFKKGDYTGAEKVFRDNLKIYPHNGRGLLGLSESLNMQGKTGEAEKTRKEFEDSWQFADVQISISDF